MSIEIINALMMVGAIIIWELIRAFIFKKINKEYVEKKDFQDLQKECRECQKELPDNYVKCEKFTREMDRLEGIHNHDVDEINKQMKGGFESITKRIDDFLNKQ
jgi:predicted nuclease with TOPRIM domain